MPETILVTGATGAVGSEVVKQLAEKNVIIRAAVHTPSKAEQLKPYDVEIVALDYANPATWQPALQSVDRVFFNGFASPTFVQLSQSFAEAALKAGVRHLVKLSAYGADFAPEFLIAKFHGESEAAIAATGIPYTHLRPNVFMQNLVNYYGWSIRQTGKFSLAQGDGKVSFIDLRDVGAAAVTVLTQPGHINQAYTLTGAEALSYFQVAETLSQATGKPITYVPLREEEARQQAQAMGQPEFMIDIGQTMDAFGRAGGFARINHQFEQLTGRKPITFAQFARDYAARF